MRGRCRSCYSRVYQEKKRREDGIQPREEVGPASGGIKVEFYVSRELNERLISMLKSHGDKSKLLRRALEAELLRMTEDPLGIES